MSEIYTDAAGNKYLGDCRWGNHDINYPTTNYLKSVDNRTIRTTFLADMLAIFTDAGWGNVSVPGSWPTTSNATLFRASPSGDSVDNYFELTTASSSPNSVGERSLVNNNIIHKTDSSFDVSLYTSNFDYVASVSSASVALKPFFYPTGYQYEGINGSNRAFWYWGKLLNVNTNFGYYSNSFLTSVVHLSHENVYGISISTLNASMTNSHYISGAKKALLQTGRAAYTIGCSDGQTPGAQWATDMWVYDNNPTLGHPVIGRVPNMLLGVGTYTYLKPVKIQGSVFPDNGSPWYLPVGIFAGKTLLMRCYSSMA